MPETEQDPDESENGDRRSHLCRGPAVLLIYRWWLGPRADPLYGVTVLPGLGGLVTTPTGINNRGQIVGCAQGADGSDHLYLWDPNGGVQDQGLALRTKCGLVPPNRYVPVGLRVHLWATDLNNRGCIVGAVQPETALESQGVLLEPILERWAEPSAR